MLAPLWAAAQTNENWDNFIISVNGHPVSIVVDLALKDKAPQKERPFSVVLRTKYLNPDENGFPPEEQRGALEQIENQLEAALKKENGAVYAGRFTQRGLREFYFYVLDTVGYMATCNRIMQRFPEYPWLAKAMQDRNWSNYFEILYPADDELEKIENRRMIKELEARGDDLSKPRMIEHFMVFKSAGGRKAFLEGLDLPGFRVMQMPVEKTEPGEFAFRLLIGRDDKPSINEMDRLTIYLGQLCRKHNGRYEGWQTHVVK